MIVIKKENFYIGMWNARVETGDFFGIAWKEPDGCWELHYRFRYYRDNKVWNSKDVKNWYEVKTASGSMEEMEKLKGVVNLMLEIGTSEGMMQSGAFVECMGDGEKMLKILDSGDRAHIHMRPMEGEELEEFKRTGKTPG